MKNNNGKQLERVYILIDEMRKEINASILRLDDKFTRLEEGRLTLIEKEVGELIPNVMLLKRIVYGLVAVILTAVVVSIVRMVLIP